MVFATDAIAVEIKARVDIFRDWAVLWISVVHTAVAVQILLAMSGGAIEIKVIITESQHVVITMPGEKVFVQSFASLPLQPSPVLRSVLTKTASRSRLGQTVSRRVLSS